jgi:hypothetical protein
MTNIFISYSKEDIEFARHVRKLLQDVGFTVWMDEIRLTPSERWWTSIEYNIIVCSAFIVIMSPNAQQSNWVEREILVAENRKHPKPIFPILFSGEVWSRLANFQYYDMQAGLNATLNPAFVDALQQYIPSSTVSVPPAIANTPTPPIATTSNRTF